MTAIEAMRKKYPSGTRVRLLEMNDPYGPYLGTYGTVVAVEDTGTMQVAWDNGCTLRVLPGLDRVVKL